MPKTVTPYEQPDKTKKEQVAAMFDNIAPKYDFLNHLLSMGIDKGWRKKAINILKKDNPELILDVATGTGDFAFEAYKHIRPQKVIGVDISREMIALGNEKIEKRGLQGKLVFEYGDSENLKFADNTFDAITVAFGVRNFENLMRGLEQMHRVLKPGAKVVVLEFSKPSNPVIGKVFRLYFKHILPFIGKIVSKDNRAYTYLFESVEVFPEKKDFIDLLKKAGFEHTSWRPLTFGICSMYIGEK